ncbi:MAG: DksA/TraR family C4-type zinc finger protein [Acetobacteraceae bacterium]|nr:DksA/TraR family C4-type zinc finger protein [Acetobacteraceae bacterium]
MATGWAKDGAVQDQIDDTIADAVKRARAHIPAPGPDAPTNCIVCGEPIPERRRQALPGIRTCIPCQSARDASPAHSPYNRRGSKDSQLK